MSQLKKPLDPNNRPLHPSEETKLGTDLRWAAILAYSGEPIRTVYFEEISDLEPIIEHGPDWNLLISCTIRLNKKD